MADIPLQLLERLRIPPIRSSAISTFERCPRKFLFSELLGIRSATRTKALDIGSVYHEAIQYLYQGVPLSEAIATVVRESAYTKNSLVRSADSEGVNPTFILQESDQALAIGLAMASEFWRLHPLDTSSYKIFEYEGNPMVEVLLETKSPLSLLGGHRVQCQFDLMIESKGDVWIVDHKTTSTSPRLRARTLPMGAQASLYKLVASQMNANVVGSVYNVIKKPSIKYCPNTKDKGGFPAYVQRVKDWYAAEASDNPDDPPIVQTWHRFDGSPVDEFPLRLTRYKEQVRYLSLLNIPGYESSRLLSMFYRAGDYVCQDFNSPCTYLDLCTSCPSTWGIQAESGKYDLEFREDTEGKPLTLTNDGHIVEQEGDGKCQQQ